MKFNNIKIGTGSIDAWSNTFTSSFKDQLENTLYGKAVTKSNVKKCIKSIRNNVFCYDSEKYISNVEFIQFLPNSGKIKVKVSNSSGIYRGIIQIQFDVPSESELELSKLKSEITRLKKRVTALETNMYVNKTRIYSNE